MTRLRAGVLALLGLALQVSAAAAQRPQGVQFGVTAGVNFATWRGSDVGPGATRRTGIHAGLTVNRNLSEAFALVSGATYSQEGSGADLGGGITGTIKVDYLRIPLYLKAGTTLRGTTPIRPYLYAGPALSFRIHCRVEAKNGSQSASAACNDPALGLKLQSTDVAVDFGGGVEIGRVSIGGRYQFGLRSVDGTGSYADVKNSVIAITAGFRL